MSGLVKLTGKGYSGCFSRSKGRDESTCGTYDPETERANAPSTQRNNNMWNLHSEQVVLQVGHNYFKDQGRVKIWHETGEVRWYLADGSEYAIVSVRNLEVLHFKRVMGGWLAVDPDDGDRSHQDTDDGYPG